MSVLVRPWERLEGKVQPRHCDRLVAVYVRQSTAQQVQDHQESTRLQYGLAERAVALGWAPSRVLVIDEDLGHSASGADARPGFQRLVSEVGLDHVGIVLGIEMSRLARSGREWHQLLELCALSGTLLGDPDGIYDPADHNDRLLLGLKGTISEAELHLIKQRMWTGRLAKARRGELAVPLPSGFVRRPSGEVALDPDGQVQAVVRLVFGLFERLGTVNGVLCFLADNRIQVGVRVREGPGRGELAWRRPTGRGCRTCSATRPTLEFTPMAAAPPIPGGGRPGGRAPGGYGPRGRTGSSSCPGCCPPISASGNTRRTGRGWRPTGPGPRTWARCVTARPCWPGWWPADAVARR
jgi:DNA invertase Pin-like site-specific DNA recombinase